MTQGTLQKAYNKIVLDNLDLKERIKELEDKNTLQKNALTWIAEEASSQCYNQSEILNVAEQALKGK